MNLSEKEIEKHLVDDFPDVPLGDIQIIDRQYEVESGVLDILAESDDYIIVIELKIETATSSVVAQTMSYLYDIDDEYEKNCIAFVIAEDFSERVWKTKRYIDNLHLYRYDLSINMHRYC